MSVDNPDSPESAAAEDGDVPVAGTGEVKIRIEDVMKRFGRVIALDGVDLEIYENEVFALVGDNGAGKSTLMNIISGVFRQTEGTVSLDDEPIDFSNPSDARERGVETVYQDLALMNDLDIATNIFMGQFPTRGAGPLEFIDWDETYDRAAEIVHDRLGREEMDLRTEVQFLSGGQRQLVAVARTLAFDPDVIVLDEPTSALSVDASRLVHRVIDRLQEAGITVVIVSHSIEDVLQIADRIGVLYQGSVAEVTTPDDADLETLTNLMTTGSRRETI
ncbi:MAG: ATP-binding cassette domain-containing protein [Salinirussus sp.]